MPDRYPPFISTDAAVSYDTRWAQGYGTHVRGLLQRIPEGRRISHFLTETGQQTCTSATTPPLVSFQKKGAALNEVPAKAVRKSLRKGAGVGIAIGIGGIVVTIGVAAWILFGH